MGMDYGGFDERKILRSERRHRKFTKLIKKGCSIKKANKILSRYGY